MPSSSSRWMFYFILQPVSDMDNPFQKEHKRCILCKYNLDVDYKVWCHCACEIFQLTLLTFISCYTGLWLFKAYTSMFWKKMQQVAYFWTVRSVSSPSVTDNLGRNVWANCAFWQKFTSLLLLAGISHGGVFPCRGFSSFKSNLKTYLFWHFPQLLKLCLTLVLSFVK